MLILYATKDQWTTVSYSSSIQVFQKEAKSCCIDINDLRARMVCHQKASGRQLHILQAYERSKKRTGAGMWISTTFRLVMLAVKDQRTSIA